MRIITGSIVAVAALMVTACGGGLSIDGNQSASTQTAVATPVETTQDSSAPPADEICPTQVEFDQVLQSTLGAIGKVETLKLGSEVACQNGVGAAHVVSRQTVGEQSNVTDSIVIIHRRDVLLKSLGQSSTDKRWEMHVGSMALNGQLDPQYCTTAYQQPKILAWLQKEGACTS